MWIAEFARQAGVKPTTVRHYLRVGLLAPRPGLAGGSRAYLEFTDADVRLMAAIQAGRALGMSLQEIQLLVAQRRSANGRAALLQSMVVQREKLRARARDLQDLLAFLDRKIAWLESGGQGPPPSHAAALDAAPASGAPARAPTATARRRPPARPPTR